MESRTKKAALNIIVKFGYQLVALVTGLIVPKLIIKTFGSSYNGAISSISQFLSVSSILTIGIAGAVKPAFYRTLASNDRLGTSVIVKATHKTFKRIGYLLLGYSALLTIIYPLIVRGQIDTFDATLLVLILSIDTFGQYYFGQTYYLLLEADQRDYIVTAIRIVVNILNALIVVLLINLGANVLVVKFGSALIYFLMPVITLLYVRRRYGIIKNCKLDMSVLKQRKAAMFHSIANIVHDKTDIMLLTVFTSVNTVSVYSVYYLVFANVKKIMQNFTTGLEGGFGSMWAKNEKDLFKKNFRTYEFFLFSFSSIVFTCVGLLIVPFIKLYTAGVKDVNYVIYSFAILASVAEAIYCIRQPYVTIVQAAGKYEETKKWAAIEAIANLIVSTSLVYFIGLNGVIIGTLVANIIRTVQYAVFSSKFLLDRSIFDFFKRIAWHILNSSLIIIIYYFIRTAFVLDTWKMWVIHGFICLTISGVIVLVTSLIFYKNDVVNLIHLTKRVLNIKKKNGSAK